MLAVAFLGILSSGDSRAALVATTAADFVQPGTQPDAATFGNFLDPVVCAECHGGYLASGEAPSDAFATSMMAQSARDPVMRAAASIANADAAASGETCIRCHAPVGWLNGRSTGGDLANLVPSDLDGVSCHVCHRLLDPITRSGAPAADAAIVVALDQAGTRPTGRCAGNTAQSCTADAACGSAAPCEVAAGQGRFVVDPADVRRGPRTIAGFHLHSTTPSPFHSRADACAPCHDVSTPTFSRAGFASYALNPLDAPHPTQDPNDMFPEQRTFSEWRASTFATTGVVFPDGRFGGAKTATLPNQVAVSTCQDCHMPDLVQRPCEQGDVHPDVGAHFFAGANSWVPGAVLDEYGAASRMTEPAVAAAADRTAAMLGAAADLEVAQVGYFLNVRVVNQTGHKLPTGYPEGRRMWLGLRVFAGADPMPIAEDGAYDAATATLDVAHTTKLYEVRQVIDQDVATATGLAAGTPFHLVLAGAVAFDDRIPPRGFTNAAFDVFGAAPVAYTYPDGQHWDDTMYTLPLAATRVEVSLYYQTTSREYAEFLRDTAPDASGQNAYDRWVARGKSAPVLMKRVTLDLEPICTQDDGPCDDLDACTTGDTCTIGACNGVQVTCPDDNNPCTDDVCMPVTGACGMPHQGPCDDFDACTTNDACTGAGTCAGTVEGIDGVGCVLDVLGSDEACGEDLPQKLRRVVDKRVAIASRLAARFGTRQAAGAPRRVLVKLLHAIDRAVAKIASRANAAEASPKPSRHISTACADRLRTLVAHERDALVRLREGVTAASADRIGG
jgi:hypothetical protein